MKSLGFLAIIAIFSGLARAEDLQPGFYFQEQTDGQNHLVELGDSSQAATVRTALGKPFSDFSGAISGVDGTESLFPISPTTHEPDFSAKPESTGPICGDKRTTLEPFMLCLRERFEQYDGQTVATQAYLNRQARVLRARMSPAGKAWLDQSLGAVDLQRDDWGLALARLRSKAHRCDGAPVCPIPATDPDPASFCPADDRACLAAAAGLERLSLATARKADVAIRSDAMLGELYRKYNLPSNLVIYTRHDANPAADVRADPAALGKAETAARKVRGEDRVANCRRRYIETPEKPRFELKNGRMIDWYRVCLEYRGPGPSPRPSPVAAITSAVPSPGLSPSPIPQGSKTGKAGGTSGGAGQVGGGDNASGSVFRGGKGSGPDIFAECHWLSSSEPPNDFCRLNDNPLRQLMPAQVNQALGRFTAWNYLELLRMEAISTIVLAHQSLTGKRLNKAESRKEVEHTLLEAGCGGLSAGIAREIDLPAPEHPKIETDAKYRKALRARAIQTKITAEAGRKVNNFLSDGHPSTPTGFHGCGYADHLVDCRRLKALGADRENCSKAGLARLKQAYSASYDFFDSDPDKVISYVGQLGKNPSRVCLTHQDFYAVRRRAEENLGTLLSASPYLAAGHDPKSEIYKDLPHAYAMAESPSPDGPEFRAAADGAMTAISDTLNKELKEYCDPTSGEFGLDSKGRWRRLINSPYLKEKLMRDLNLTPEGRQRVLDMHACVQNQIERGSGGTGFIMAACIVGSILPGTDVVAIPACGAYFLGGAYVDYVQAGNDLNAKYDCALVASVCSSEEWKQARSEWESALTNLWVTGIGEAVGLPGYMKMLRAGRGLGAAELRAARAEIEELSHGFNGLDGIADTGARRARQAELQARARNLANRLEGRADGLGAPIAARPADPAPAPNPAAPPAPAAPQPHDFHAQRIKMDQAANDARAGRPVTYPADLDVLVGDVNAGRATRTSWIEPTPSIGEGSSGLVYRAKIDGVPGEVAIKAYRPESVGMLGGRETAERFMALEFQQAKALEEAGVGPRVYGLTRLPDGRMGIAMERVAGESSTEMRSGLFINQHTIDDARASVDKLRRSGYAPGGDFQGVVSPNGRFSVIDATSLKRASDCAHVRCTSADEFAAELIGTRDRATRQYIDAARRNGHADMATVEGVMNAGDRVATPVAGGGGEVVIRSGAGGPRLRYSAQGELLGVEAQPVVDMGKQGKHIPGHNNHIPGRSTLTADPQTLAVQAGTGQPVGKVPRGQAGFKERVDFGSPIGEFVDATGAHPTNFGIIHYDGAGKIHIVPSRPGGG